MPRKQHPVREPAGEKHESLASVVADRLRAALPGYSGRTLPPVRRLCRELGVSHPTLACAMRRLEDEGVIRRHPKRRTEIVGRAPDGVPPDDLLPAERLYDDLRDRIERGVYPSGTPLPKLAHFALSMHLSRGTVAKVYGRLGRAGMIHKAGKAFVAGSPRREAGRLKGTVRFVVILTYGPQVWRGVYRSRWTGEFGQAFVREAERHGVRLVEVVTEGFGARSASTSWASTVREKIRQLGTGYVGTMIVGNESEIPDVATWADALASFGRPVAWFDRSNSGNLAPRRGRIRFYPSEDATVKAALDCLHAAGHRRVCYLYHPGEAWQEERGRRLIRIAGSLAPALEVIAAPVSSDADWMEPAQSGILARIDALSRSGAPPVARAIKAICSRSSEIDKRYNVRLCRTPAWEPYGPIVALTRLRHEGKAGVDDPLMSSLGRAWAGLALWPCLANQCTAVIAPNDASARSHHLIWAADYGLRVPADLSVIGFDNTNREVFVPLTTVDFGFYGLGYQAFHALLEDIPIRVGRTGAIAATPLVIDRGSVGAAAAVSGAQH